MNEELPKVEDGGWVTMESCPSEGILEIGTFTPDGVLHAIDVVDGSDIAYINKYRAITRCKWRLITESMKHAILINSTPKGNA